MCGIEADVLPDRDVYSDRGKNKKFLFLIRKKEMKLPLSISVTRNPN
jgi:hypothetical protein